MPDKRCGTCKTFQTDGVLNSKDLRNSQNEITESLCSYFTDNNIPTPDWCAPMGVMQSNEGSDCPAWQPAEGKDAPNG